MDHTDNMRLYFEADGTPRRWTQCSHKWYPFFGTALRCQHCGAGTILNLGDAKEQPIDAPLSVVMELRNLPTIYAMSNTPKTDHLERTPFGDGHAAREAFLKHARQLESAYSDLMGQIRAMKERSDLYFKEAEAGSDEAEKHLRVFNVLKELERLGEAFRNR